METTESITRAALDTLSSQVAVIDSEGRILFTNSAWRDFGENESVAAADMRGRNYFESVDPDADDFAGEAVSGLREVLEGERDSFQLEYPCHSEDTKRWFMMRATPFSIGPDDFATVAHIDITDRRLAEIEATDHAWEAEQERANLEHLVDRINGLVQDITRLLVEAGTREEIERGVCERLAATDPYCFAWIGSADFSRQRLEPRASEGDIDAPLATERPLDADSEDPSTRALLEESVQVRDDVADISSADGIEYGADAGVESLIAVPLTTRDTRYGVLTVYANDPSGVDKRERLVLEALGRAIANAINALESKRTLTATRIVELEFTVDDDSLFVTRLSEAADCTLNYTGSVYQSEGALGLFFSVTGADPDAVLAAATDDEAVSEARVLAEYDDEFLLQATVTDTLVATLMDRGAVTQALSVEDGIARYTVELPRESDARALFEYVTEQYDNTELVGYHEHERPIESRQEFRADLEDRLTDRQLTALRTAYFSGFFAWPREVDGDELAEMMDISRSTFHQHLRVAERKILDAFFEYSS
jgi:PAS domain S-box-containing protein